MIMQKLLGLGFLGILGACSSSSPQPRELEYVPEVTLDDFVSGQDGIEVKWYFFAAMLLTPENDFITPGIFDHFRVVRQDSPFAEWRVVAERLPALARTYLDRDVEPEALYRYRIISYLADGRSSSIETPDLVRGPSRWSLLFERPECPKEGGPESVSVQISKYEKGIGRVVLSRVQLVGEPLGWWAESPKEPPSFRHRVTLSDGGTADVDFDCGATLVEVTPTIRALETQGCKEILDPRDGSWLGCQRIVEKISFGTHEGTYRDSWGSPKTLIPEPVVKDHLCSRHHLDPNEPPRDQRLFEARLLLDEADSLWESDSTASIRTYQRLLKEFGDIVAEFRVRNRVQRRGAQAED